MTRAITEARRKLLIGFIVLVYGLMMFVPSFWLYGTARTMRENFGFSWSSSAVAAAFAALFVFLPQFVSMVLLRRGSRLAGVSTKSLWLASLAAWLIGCAVAEGALLVDERRFESEGLGSEKSVYSRGRSWPHTDAGLVYNAGKFHATD